MYTSNRNNKPSSMGKRIQPKAEKPSSPRRSIGERMSGFQPGRLLPAAIAVLIIGGAFILGSLYTSDSSIQSISVNGNYFTTEQEIITRSGIPLQVSADSVSFLAAMQHIETLPYVKNAAIKVGSRGVVYISVTERKPIGLFINGTRRVYADRDGVILPIKPGKAVDVPLVYGIGWSARQDTLRSDAFMQMRDFLTIAQQLPLAAATLSEIAWTSDEGIVALSHENGIRLVFGRDRYREALENWDLFYRQVVAVRGPQQFTSVDLRYNGQIVTRES